MNMSQINGDQTDLDSAKDNGQSGSIFKKTILNLRTLLRFRAKNSLKESVEEAIEEHESSIGQSIEEDEKTMLRNVLSFAQMDVADVMIPRADISGVEYNISYTDLKALILKNAHTRIPVYRQNLDDIQGFIHIKDLLSVAYNKDKKFDIPTMIRQCLFVPPSMKTSDLLVKMQLSHVHIAIVVDEYGGTDGLVTLEDLVEEIVGEIEDEHDIVEEIMFTPLGDDMFEASARIDIEDLENKLGVQLSKDDDGEDFDTLGGLIFSIIGRIPALGEIIFLPSLDDQFNFEFEVIDADLRKVKKVIIRRKAKTTNN